jgi:hypothetical protein
MFSDCPAILVLFLYPVVRLGLVLPRFSRHLAEQQVLQAVAEVILVMHPGQEKRVKDAFSAHPCLLARNPVHDKLGDISR